MHSMQIYESDSIEITDFERSDKINIDFLMHQFVMRSFVSR